MTSFIYGIYNEILCTFQIMNDDKENRHGYNMSSIMSDSDFDLQQTVEVEAEQEPSQEIVPFQPLQRNWEPDLRQYTRHLIRPNETGIIH